VLQKSIEHLFGHTWQAIYCIYPDYRPLHKLTEPSVGQLYLCIAVSLYLGEVENVSMQKSLATKSLQSN